MKYLIVILFLGCEYKEIQQLKPLDPPSEEPIADNPEATPEPDPMIFNTNNGGANKGMVNIADMVSRLNDLETLFTALKTNINAWVVTPNDGGAKLYTQLTTPGTGFATKTIPSSTVGDFEDTKIKH